VIVIECVGNRQASGLYGSAATDIIRADSLLVDAARTAIRLAATIGRHSRECAFPDHVCYDFMGDHQSLRQIVSPSRGRRTGWQ